VPRTGLAPHALPATVMPVPDVAAAHPAAAPLVRPDSPPGPALNSVPCPGPALRSGLPAPTPITLMTDTPEHRDWEDESHAPIVWREPFPPHLQAALVSFDNPKGTVTNSDLELAATIAHQDVLVHTFDLHERTIHTGSDNTPAVYWQRKGRLPPPKPPPASSVFKLCTNGTIATSPSSPTSLAS